MWYFGLKKSARLLPLSIIKLKNRYFITLQEIGSRIIFVQTMNEYLQRNKNIKETDKINLQNSLAKMINQEVTISIK